MEQPRTGAGLRRDGGLRRASRRKEGCYGGGCPENALRPATVGEYPLRRTRRSGGTGQVANNCGGWLQGRGGREITGR